MSKPKITCKRDGKDLKIYINGLLHLQIMMDNHVGIQSWYEGTNHKHYKIEFYQKEGESFYSAYQIRETWEEILRLVDKNI